MSTIKKPSKLLEQLIVATKFSLELMAERLGISRQFLYNINDNRPDSPRLGAVSCAEDPRYMKLDTLCKAHGIQGFIAAMDAVLAIPKPLPNFDRLAVSEGLRSFGYILVGTGVMIDPEVSRLYTELGQRLRELSK